MFTAQPFDTFAAQPEHGDRIFELVGGSIFEKPLNPYRSMVATKIICFLVAYEREYHTVHVLGSSAGYQITGDRYVPDTSVILKSRQPKLPFWGYNPVSPDLAVEVDFPSTRESRQTLNMKLANYLAARTVVWIVYPDAKEVEVYTPGQPARILTINDTLDGGDVLPGFTLPVKDVFAG